MSEFKEIFNIKRIVILLFILLTLIIVLLVAHIDSIERDSALLNKKVEQLEMKVNILSEYVEVNND